MSFINPSENPYTTDWPIKATSLDLAWDLETGQMLMDAQRDIVFSTGEDELRQRVLHGLLTNPGEIPHRPDWGVGLTMLQNSSVDSADLSKLSADIRTFLGNSQYYPEIVAVDSITYKRENQQVSINVTVKTIYGVLRI